jgi:glycosyltransferase involved in cell wall biosynthesis
MGHRVMFVLPRMVSGGVERVTLNLMRALKATGSDCTLALRQARGEMMEEAGALVETRELAAGGMLHFVPNLAAYIEEWKPTHIVTAFADIGLLTHAALRKAGSQARLIHGVHDSHGPEVARPGIRGRLRHVATNAMARAVYRRASAIVTVSDGARDELLARFPVAPDRVRTIYNPVIDSSHLVARRKTGSSGIVRVVAVGRLARQKGFDVMVEAANGLRTSRRWVLDIHGDGPERSRLEDDIRRLGLSDLVKLHGYTPTPMDAMRQADIFVLPSRHEGLPTVLIEALACQTQIVATDCRHGPREILLGGKLGALVPVEDVAALRQALQDAIDGNDMVDPRELLGRAEDFTVAASLTQWQSLFSELAAR